MWRIIRKAFFWKTKQNKLTKLKNNQTPPVLLMDLWYLKGHDGRSLHPVKDNKVRPFLQTIWWSNKLTLMGRRGNKEIYCCLRKTKPLNILLDKGLQEGNSLLSGEREWKLRMEGKRELSNNDFKSVVLRPAASASLETCEKYMFSGPAQAY